MTLAVCDTRFVDAARLSMKAVFKLSYWPADCDLRVVFGRE